VALQRSVRPDLDQPTDSVRAIKRGIVLAFNPPRDGDLTEVNAAASDARPLASRCLRIRLYVDENFP